METATKRELKILLKRGEDALIRKDFERASTYFRRVYSADPKNSTAITNLGYAYAKMGRFSHAHKCFTTALDIDPDNLIAKKNLSLLIRPQNDTRPHSILLPKRGSEDQFRRYMEWGNLQMEQKNYYAAIQYFREASKIHPDFIEPYLKIGISFEELNEYASASIAFSEALEIFPKDPLAQDHLNRCRGLSDGDQYMGTSFEKRGETPSDGNTLIQDSFSSSSKTSDNKLLSELNHLLDDNKPDQIHTNTLSGTLPKQEYEEKSGKPQVHPSKTAPQNTAPQSEDEVIRSILDQYSDLISSGRTKSGDTTSQAVQSDGNKENPVSDTKEARSPGTTQTSDDDIVSNILMQYQDDLDPLDLQVPDSTKSKPELSLAGEGPSDEGGNNVTKKKKNGIHVELNDNQKDALRELGNIGASHAATTLSTMLNTPIMLNVPEISIMDFEEVSKQIPHENSAMVIFTMEGQMAKAGYVILHVPQESVVQMTSIMLGMPIEPDREMNEMDESAINEIGNIMVSAFLDGTAELLGIIMLPSPPRTLFDFPKKIFDLIIQESNILYDNVVFFRTELICDEHELNLNIFMLPNPPVLQEIVRMLEKMIEDSAVGN